MTIELIARGFTSIVPIEDAMLFSGIERSFGMRLACLWVKRVGEPFRRRTKEYAVLLTMERGGRRAQCWRFIPNYGKEVIAAFLNDARMGFDHLFDEAAVPA